MTDDRRGIRRTFRVGHFTCELTIPVLGPGMVGIVTAEWSPQVPGSLSLGERAAYEAELARALAEALEIEP